MNECDERTGAAATSYLFTGGRLLDPNRDALLDGFEVLVENDRIKEVSDRADRGREAPPGSIFPARH